MCANNCSCAAQVATLTGQVAALQQATLTALFAASNSSNNYAFDRALQALLASMHGECQCTSYRSNPATCAYCAAYQALRNA